MTQQIITFYEFRKLKNLPELRLSLLSEMRELSIFGTIILAREGFNATVCGSEAAITEFVARFEIAFDTTLQFKTSFHGTRAFQRQKVKIKQEIVTLRREVDLTLGTGTHVSSADWNEIINDPETFVLDARNDYEFQAGTFQNAANPSTGSFNELPEFVEKNLDPRKHKRIATFCTGGIRCEKIVPFLKEKGFEQVFQLKGGILRYLEEISEDESLWRGECFVFDERISIDENLEKGSGLDLSLESKAKSVK